MFKRLLKNASLYMLSLANLAYCVRHGFNWVAGVALALSGISLVLDIAAEAKHGKDQ